MQINRSFLNVDKYCAKWTTQDEESSEIFTQMIFKQSVKFPLCNCFFKVKNKRLNR